MKDVKSIISDLRNSNIKISLNDGNIEIDSAKEKLSEDIVSEIRFNKEKIVEYLKQNANSTVFNRIQPVENESDYPLSPSQRRLWILSQFEDANIAYNISQVYILEGFLDRAALEYSFQQLIQRHEILRTIFDVDKNGTVRQYVTPPEDARFTITFKDLRSISEKKEKVREIIGAECNKPFVLSSGPLLRSSVLQTADDQWILICALHHIITDGWSMGILIKEIMLFYNAYASGEKPELPALPIQYKDYAVWQQQQLRAESLNVHRSYWFKKFEGSLPRLIFPGDSRRPAVKTYNAAFTGRMIPEKIGRELKLLTHGQDSSLFMGLLAAINILLYRYTGQNDIIIGTPVAGREHIDLERQIGLYANTLVLRFLLTSSASYRQLIAEVRQMVLEAHQHQIYPFDELVQDLNLQGDMSRNPLFDIQVIVHNAETGNGKSNPGLDGLKIRGYEGKSKETSIFDMVFNFTELETGIYLDITYNQDVYSCNTVQQLVGDLDHLLKNIVSNPDTPVEQLNFLNESHQKKLLIEFNDTATEYHKGNTLVSLFEAQVKKTPDSPAVVFGQNELTYRQLSEKANQLAGYLIENYAIGPEELIGVMLDRNEMMLVAILGILKTGAAYLPVDPEYPKKRKEFIIKDGGVKLLITQTENVFDLDYYEGTVFAIDVQLNAIQLSGEIPERVGDASSLAYVIYTSGSTGEPKGVMIEHGTVVNTILSQRSIFDIRPGERGLQFASLSFDASVSEIFIILLSGAVLYIIDEDTKKDPILLENYIVNNRIEIATIPPAYLKLLQMKRLLSLKKLITAGEPAIAELAITFARHGVYYNAYGPTESSICASVYTPKDGSSIDADIVPIGRPIANTQIYIVDQQMNLAPIGSIGEICIGGAGLARGYLNKPDITKEKFVDDPFNPGNRIYKTGDLGKWLPDGNIVFIGRKDNQIKIRGYRIELGEIEYTLQKHDNIDTAVVLARADDGGQNELVAFIVWKTATDLSDIRFYLGKLLPSYMIPSTFIPVLELPLTPNGKIDRKELLAMEGLSIPGRVEYVAPTGMLEKQLVIIWEELLNKQGIGIKDDFFELGGNSLKAMIFIKKWMDTTGIAIPAKVIFAERQIENLAKYIEYNYTSSDGLSYREMLKETRQISPASYNQLIYFSKWKTGGDETIVSSYEFADIQMNALRSAVYSLAERHETLRTVFERIDGMIMQRVLPMTALDLKIKGPIKVSSGDELHKLIKDQRLTRIDLYSSPLFHINICKIDDGNYHIVFTNHHIISDGYSLQILKDELTRLYLENIHKVPSGLPGLPFQYMDFSTWQREFVNSKEGAAHKAYWSRKLKGLSADLRTDGTMTAPKQQVGKPFCISRVIDPDAYSRLETFARKNSLTNSTILMGALILLLKYSRDRDDITLFTTVSGRNSRFFGDLTVTGLIGFFVNTLLVRNQVDDNQSLLTYLHKVRDNFLEDLAYESYPFDKLINELPGIDFPALFDSLTFYNYHNYPYLKELNYKKRNSPEIEELNNFNSMLCAMGLSVEEYGNYLDLKLMFKRPLFTVDTASILTDRYFFILEQIVSSPFRTVKELIPLDTK